MLVLSRNRNEALVIGDNIRVTVLGIKGDRVQIGIDAPLAVPVHRAEVHRRIIKEQSPLVPVLSN